MKLNRRARDDIRECFMRSQLDGYGPSRALRFCCLVYRVSLPDVMFAVFRVKP